MYTFNGYRRADGKFGARNPNTYNRMSHDMDLNAGLIIEGKKNVEQVGEEAFSVLIDTLNGRATKNEALGYFGSVDIFCLGPVI